ncbi:MAG TPA: hypothetical protein PK788_00720 [Gemmatimonadaceae bacterium]|nr:hypothetical protein [Gemmatimonadaceae bacterium]HRQ78411.1 hypothetical protein [Gemmatimonadaceae bacterium]
MRRSCDAVSTYIERLLAKAFGDSPVGTSPEHRVRFSCNRSSGLVLRY